jgi:hypothetical protein
MRWIENDMASWKDAGFRQNVTFGAILRVILDDYIKH